MLLHRNKLPQLPGGLFLTDGGIETTLIYHHGIDLPEFAAFVLLKDAKGFETLRDYYRPYVELAQRLGAGMILESATWRANPEWAAKLGYSNDELDTANRRAIDLLVAIRNENSQATAPMVISGCVGPRGDGYRPTQQMSARDAQSYHQRQIDVFAESAADLVSALTINYVEEAIGITEAARHADMPVVISFTVETDGNLATGQSLQSAVEQVDSLTSAYPSYFMINCAHPSHFKQVLQNEAPWVQRIRGLRANSSTKSHAELNESTELDIGDPHDLGQLHARLKQHLPLLTVFGGCCGTDVRHVEQIALACGAH